MHPFLWSGCTADSMLLFAGGGLWKMRLVATGVPTTSGASYLSEFTLVKCSGVAGVRWDWCYSYPQMSPRGKSLNEGVISDCKLRLQYLQNLSLIFANQVHSVAWQSGLFQWAPSWASQPWSSSALEEASLLAGHVWRTALPVAVLANPSGRALCDFSHWARQRWLWQK